MYEAEVKHSLIGHGEPMRERMQTPEDVGLMLRLAQQGWGTKRIALQLGCSKNTVKRHLRAGGWRPYAKPRRPRKLAGLESWLKERFRQHRGNADVVRQDLAREHGIVLSLRTVERAVQGLRRAWRAEALATIRFETAPGEQLQIDFGTVTMAIASESTKVRLFVATLGYSRRVYVQAFTHERQSAWIEGIEGAFRHFGGSTRELLLDNAKPLVDYHNVQSNEIRFNDRFGAFCRYWDVKPRACAPYRARTKGKDERGVRYVKENAIAGHTFASLEALRAHLGWWMREIADLRVHGTTAETPAARFAHAEQAALRPLQGRAPWHQVRELVRRVHADACVELDTNHYSVPWRLIGEVVTLVVEDELQILHAGSEVARHRLLQGRHGCSIDRLHLLGVVVGPVPASAQDPVPAPELLRPLSEYEAALAGAA